MNIKKLIQEEVKRQLGLVEENRGHEIMTVKEVVEYIEDNEDEVYPNYYAIRGDNHIPLKKFRESRCHADDIRRPFKIGGVSAISIHQGDEKSIRDALKRSKIYGKNSFLLEGYLNNAHEVYHDYEEVLVSNDHRIVCMIID